MAIRNHIPSDVSERLLHFQEQVQKHFSFLIEFNFCLEEIKRGQSDFLEYYSKFIFKKDDLIIDICFTTDIIKGHTTKFPQVQQKPVIDNLVSCFISDTKALMSVECFAETMNSAHSETDFSIDIKSENVKDEVSRVVVKYSDFIQKHLVDVLTKEKMYDCYTNRFYEKIFKEFHYT
jgi:hypothetical protein